MRWLFAAFALLPAIVAGAADASPAIAPPELDGGYLKLGFDRLAAFKFIAPEFDPVANPKAQPPTGEEQIPAVVKGWSGRKAVVTGFMQPIRMENAKAVEFLLMANQMACCYGMTPNVNEWVIVRCPKGVPIIQDIPISFKGTFRVSVAFENGYMTGIYEMDAEGPGVVLE